ncbi:hypothetical protein [Corynebacterium mucifaciens]|uniref:Zn-dependent alcohol dehydrogenase n=1 Tax=Corynebacterium mucifaciens TaxID=57171 RepID=A0A7X6RDU9_9CORY|nr:hypothetical protein [Corynebacterium mucifaciens]NKY68026.1 hypothetical protein [Corynebacterium mucifaciens]
MRNARRAFVALAASALALGGCSAAGLQHTGKDPVAIGIDADDPEQVVLGEIYRHILQQLGRPASVIPADFATDDTLSALKEEPVDFVVACTGRLVVETNTAAAQQLAEEAEAGAEGMPETVYDAAVAALPASVRTVDPSPAEGCSGAGDLPQNVIPLFTAGMFDRGEINRLNFITRVMATDRIEEMVDEVEDGSSVEDALAEWMMEYAHIDVYADEVADPDDSGAAAGDSADQSGAR